MEDNVWNERGECRRCSSWLPASAEAWESDRAVRELVTSEQGLRRSTFDCLADPWELVDMADHEVWSLANDVAAVELGGAPDERCEQGHRGCATYDDGPCSDALANRIADELRAWVDGLPELRRFVLTPTTRWHGRCPLCEEGHEPVTTWRVVELERHPRADDWDQVRELAAGVADLDAARALVQAVAPGAKLDRDEGADSERLLRAAEGWGAL